MSNPHKLFICVASYCVAPNALIIDYCCVVYVRENDITDEICVQPEHTSIFKGPMEVFIRAPPFFREGGQNTMYYALWSHRVVKGFYIAHFSIFPQQVSVCEATTGLRVTHGDATQKTVASVSFPELY